MTFTAIDGTTTIAVGSMTQPAQASIESPTFNLNDPAAYDLLTDGAESLSGEKVSEERALGHPAVWQAIDMISGDIASLPLEVFRKEPNGNREPQDNTPLENLVLWQPNEEMTAFVFWKRMMTYRLLWNNAYAWIWRNGDGTPREIIPLLPDRTHPVRDSGRLYVVTEVDGELIYLNPQDVFHLEGLSLDGLAGFKLVRAARQVIGLGLAEIGFVSKFFRQGGRVGGILEVPSSLSKTAKDKIEQGFAQRYSSSAAFQTVVLREGARFHQAQVSPDDAQVIEGRQESVRDVARYFNIRPGKLGEESRTSFASKAEDNKDHHDTTLRPHLRNITQECRSKLLTKGQKRDRLYFQHDLQEFLRADLESMANAISTLRSSEVISPNDGRSMLNMNRVEGGDDYTNPNTRSSEPANRTEPEPDDRGQAAVKAIMASTVFRLASLTADRAKKKAKDPVVLASWLAEKHDSYRGSVSAAIGEVVESAAHITSIDVKEKTDQITDAFMSDAKALLGRVANNSSPDDLRELVGANMTEWASQAGAVFADKLFDGG